MFILVEIGGIIAVNIINIDMEDIIKHGWLELNQQTRNLIQSNVSTRLISIESFSARFRHRLLLMSHGDSWDSSW